MQRYMPPPRLRIVDEHVTCPLCAVAVRVYGGSKQRLFDHMEKHLRDGLFWPDEMWAREDRFACKDCGRIVQACKHENHRHCKARAEATITRPNQSQPTPIPIVAEPVVPPKIEGEVVDALPSFFSICTTQVTTLKKIPTKARHAYANSLSKVMIAAMHHCDLANWLLLAMFPKCVSRAGKRGGKSKRGQFSSNASSVLAALRRWDAGEYASLWDETLASVNKRKSSAMSVDEARIMRCEALARDGEFGRAMAALTSDDMAPCDEASADILRSKHPSPVRPAAPCYAVSPQLPITEEVVMSALRTFPRGSSPGNMGLRAEHLRDAVSNVTPVGFLSTLTRLVNFFRDGRVPPAAQPYFAGGRLCALIKPNKDLRPIAAGETLRRLTSKALCAMVKEDAKGFFSGLQYGVATRNGTERIIHCLRSQAASHASDADWVILKIDLINAFNRISRARFLELVSVHFPALATWASWCYSAESVLSFGEFVVQSMEGVQQGDPLGPLLFALVMHVLLQEISAEIPDLDVNRAYLDDAVFAGKSADVLKVLRVLEERGPAVGLHLNHAKCELIASPAAAHVLSSFPAAIPAKQRATDGNFSMLGTPIGTPAYCAQYLREHALEPAERTLSALSRVNDPQIALTLLRQCSGFCQMVYALRTTPSTYIREMCKDFDLLVLKAFESCVCPVPQRCHRQMRRGTSSGGVGLRDTFQHADAAYIGSVMTCAAAEGWDPNTMVEIQAVMDSFNSRVQPSKAVMSLDAVIAQRDLSTRIDDQNYAAEYSAATLDGKARLRGQSGSSASSWITAIPSRELGFAFSSREYVTLMKWWLGLHVIPQNQLCATCGEKSDPGGYHALVCKKSGGTVYRHNSLCKEFAAFCRGAYLCPSMEVSFGEGTRPADVFIPSWEAGQALATDFAVTHSQQPTYRNSAVLADSGEAGAVAAAYARTHKARGAAECARNGVQFRPMVVEVFGSWDPNALQLLNAVARQYAHCQGVPVPEASHNMLQRMSVILQRQNVRMLLTSIGSADLVHEEPLTDHVEPLPHADDANSEDDAELAAVVETVEPVRAPATVPVRGPPAPHLSHYAIAKMPKADQRSALAPRLLAAVTDITPALASVVTEMLMEMDVSELINVLDSPAILRAKVVEAAEVLGQGHNVLECPLALQAPIREASEAQKESSKTVPPPLDFSTTSPSLPFSFLCEANVAPQCCLASAFDGVACAPVTRTPKNKNKNKK